MEIAKIAIEKINPAPYNPRQDLKPGDPDYEKLRKSLEEFDCVEPLVWNKRTGHLVGGHQRLKVLKARGDREVMVSVVDLPLDKEKSAKPRPEQNPGRLGYAQIERPAGGFGYRGL